MGKIYMETSKTQYLGLVIEQKGITKVDKNPFYNFFPTHKIIDGEKIEALKPIDITNRLGYTTRKEIARKSVELFYDIDDDEENEKMRNYFLLNERNTASLFVVNDEDIKIRNDKAVIDLPIEKVKRAEELGIYPIITGESFPNESVAFFLNSEHTIDSIWGENQLPNTNYVVIRGRGMDENSIYGPCGRIPKKNGIYYKWEIDATEIYTLVRNTSPKYKFDFVKLNINQAAEYFDVMSNYELKEKARRYYAEYENLNFANIWKDEKECPKDIIEQRCKRINEWFLRSGLTDDEKNSIVRKKEEVTDLEKVLSSITEHTKDKMTELVDYLIYHCEEQKKRPEEKEVEEKEVEEKLSEEFYFEKIEHYKDVATFQGDKEAVIEHMMELIHKEREEKSYDRNTIVNLFTCIMQGFLTVFAGDPGCGKTSICDIIGKVLGLTNLGDSEYNRYLNLSVERGWMSKRDLIGYFNPISQSIDKNNEALYDGLKMLHYEKENLEKPSFPFLVLLDEANLSPMEYYWSDFMNVCDEIKKESNINLGGGENLKIPQSLRFLATINTDNTTYPLSPRLINRSWVITLPKGVMKENWQQIDEKECIPISWDTLKSIFGCMKVEGSGEKQPVLDTTYAGLYKTVKESFARIGIDLSSRVENNIASYWNVAKSLFEEDEEGRSAELIAFDYAIMQRVLPQINGFGEEYGLKLMDIEMLKEYDDDMGYEERSEEEYEAQAGLLQILENIGLTKSTEIVRKIVTRGREDKDYYHFF